MAVDMFLKIDGIPGESTDAKHRDEIVLESFSWGETHAASRAGTAGGAGAGRVSMQDFHFTSRVSVATPRLMLKCATGEHIKEGVLTVRKAGEQKEGFEFLMYKFEGLVITSVQEAGDDLEIPLDSVSFAFEKIDVTYKLQTAAGGIGAVVDFAWNLTANKKI